MGLEPSTIWASSWFVALGLFVLGPLLRPGYLLLLDSPAGPRPPWPPLFPLPSEGLVNANLFSAGAARISALISPQLPNKLLIFFCIFVGGLGMFRFLRRELGVTALAATAAGTMFVINPFVYDRLLAGQLLFTAGYALLPWALPSTLRVVRGGESRDVVQLVCWTVALSLVDLHAGGLMLLLAGISVVAAPVGWKKRSWYVLLTIGALFGAHLFWLLPSLLASEVTRLGPADLTVYAPRPRSPEILPRVLMLHGFWRKEFPTPLGEHAQWFLSFFLILGAIISGGLIVASARAEIRRWVGTLASVLVIALVLAMGTSFPPTAGITRFLYERIPGYGIFREPQKWAALLALGYSIFLGIGVSWLAKRYLKLRLRTLLTTAFVLLPLGASPLMLWGMAGQAHVSEFPTGWSKAAELLDGKQGRTLILPWNLYQPLPFADDRTIGNPANHFFPGRPVVTADAGFVRSGTTADPDPRNEFISQLIDQGERVDALGHLIAPLGIRYVLLVYVADAPEYDFLETQDDLSLMLSEDSVVLYENEMWKGSVQSLPRGDPRELDELLANPELQERSAGEISFERLGRTQTVLPGARLFDVSLFWEEESLERPGLLGTSKSCDDGWQLAGSGPICDLGNIAAYQAPNESARLWRPLAIAQAVGFALAGLTVGSLVLFGRRYSRTSKSIYEDPLVHHS